MSLINKVLRDLDSRHAAEEQKALPNEVRPLPPAESGRHPTAAPAIAVLLVVAAAGTWVAWAYLSRPTAAASPAVVEAPPPPILIIAPPEPPTGNAAATKLQAPPQPATTTIAPTAESPAPSLRIATSLQPRPPVAAVASAVAPPSSTPASIDKQFRDDAHTRAETAYRAATSEQRQGRGADAMARLRDALREDPRHGNARQLLLSLLVERQQWPEAETLLREGLELTPANAAWAIALARIEVERGQSDQAWATLQKYMTAGEGNADYQGFAGVLLQRLQRPVEAIGHYEAALRVKADARWWAGLALSLEAAGRADEAREAFRRAQTIGGLTPDMAAVVDRHLK